MMRPEGKQLQALAALLVLVAACFLILSPVASALGSVNFKSTQLQMHKDRTAMLKERYETERQEYAEMFRNADPVIRFYVRNAVEKFGGIDSTCVRLTERFAARNIEVNASCDSAQSPISEDYVRRVVEIKARGPAEDILAALDESNPNETVIVQFRLSAAGGAPTEAISAFSMQLVEIQQKIE